VRNRYVRDREAKDRAHSMREFCELLHAGVPFGEGWVAFLLMGPRTRRTKNGKEEPVVRQYFSPAGVLPCQAHLSTGRVSMSVCLFAVRSRKQVHAIRVPALWAEIDPPASESLDDWQERTRSALRSFCPAPSMVVFSGRGWHAYWVFVEPLDLADDADGRLRQQIVQANQALQARLGGDGVSDLSRVMRMPGTINQRTGCLSRIEYSKGPRYDARALLDGLVGTGTAAEESNGSCEATEVGPPLAGPAQQPRRPGRPTVGVTVRDLRALPPRMRSLVVGGVWAAGTRYKKAAGGLDRSRADFAAVHAMVRAGWSDSLIVAAFERVDWFIGARYRELRDGAAQTATGQRRASAYLARTIAKIRDNPTISRTTTDSFSPGPHVQDASEPNGP
jgi:hypothetical protein